MLLACKKGDLDYVFELYHMGFKIISQLGKLDSLKSMEYGDILKELTIFEAECSAAYLIAEHYFDRKDPVSRAFFLIHNCQVLIKHFNRLLHDRIKGIRRTLKEFTLKMIDLCEDLNEAEIFLNKDDGLLSVRGMKTMLPRIGLALHLKNNKFIVHEYSQLIARKAFTGDRDFKNTRNKEDICSMVLLVLVTPIICIAYSLNKNGLRLPCTWARNLLDPWYRYIHTPAYQLKIQAAVYMIMIITGALTLTRILNLRGDCKLEWYDIVSFILAMGFMAIDLEQIYFLAGSVNKVRTGNCLQKTFDRLKDFFANGFYVYRFVGHCSFVVGSTLKVIGYNLKWLQPEGSDNSMEENHCNVSEYKGYHIVNVGNSLQGVAIVIVISQLLQLLRQRPDTSMIYAAMQRSIKTVLSFTFFYFTVMFAFSLSIFHVVHESHRANCTEKEEFDTLLHSIKTLVWVTFADASPEVFDDREGISRYVGLALFWLFNFIMALVLMNLLIAVMSSIMSTLSDNKVNAWKCHRLKLWMQYCNNGVVLPPPMNLLDALITLPVLLFKRNKHDQ